MAGGTAPLIGLPACIHDTSRYTWHSVAEQYVRAVLTAGGVPILLPALGTDTDLAALLGRLDGLSTMKLQ